MGGQLIIKKHKPPLNKIIVDILCVPTPHHQVFDVKNQTIAATPKLLARFTSNKVQSQVYSILADSGASISCIRHSTLAELKNEGITVNPVQSLRAQPTSANSTLMQILGDVILSIILYSENNTLEVKNIRFSIFQELSVSAIIGMEVLRVLEFKIVRQDVFLHGLKVDTATSDVFGVEMTVVDILEVSKDEQDQVAIFTIQLSRPNDYQTIPVGNYLMTPFLSTPAKCMSLSSEDTNLFESYLVHSTQLNGTMNFQTHDDFPTLHSIIHVKMEKVKPIVNNLSATENTGAAQLKRLATVDPEKLEKLVQKSEFPITEKLNLKEIIMKNIAVFSKDDDDIGRYNGGQVKLELKDPHDTPQYVRPRRTPYALRPWLQEKLESLVKKGVIGECCGSPFNSPVLLVKKPNGKYRLCIDLRNVNRKLKENKYPIPRIADLLDKVSGSKCFSSIDFTSGFFNIEIDEESRPLTAFSCLNKQYYMKRLPMGCLTSPSAFQSIMMKVAGPMLATTVIIYIDDLLVHTKDEKSHLKALDEVFTRFGKAGFLINPNKVTFATYSLDYLGFTINQKGWSPKRSNVEAIQKFPRPLTKTNVRSFNGLCAFYSNCLPNLQYILGPLHEIAGTKSKFIWGPAQEAAFEEAKHVLSNYTMIAFPSNNEKDILYLTMDASNIGWGVALSQSSGDGTEKPLGFASGRFRGSQLNWPIQELELFSFVRGLEIFHVHLYLRKFVWRTDNLSLSYLTSESMVKKEPKRLSQKVARWMDFISCHSFSIQHFKGTAPVMKPVDALSRNPAEIALVSAQGFRPKIIPFWVQNPTTLAELLLCQKQDVALQKGNNGWETLTKKCRFRKVVIEKVIYFKGEKKENLRLAIPKKLERKCFEHNHLPEHSGTTKMYSRLTQKYIFPNMYSKLTNYIATCELCVAFKIRQKPKTAKIPTSVGIYPFAYIQIDLQGPISKTLHGNLYILVTVCLLTRWCEMRAIPSKTAEDVGKALMEIFLVRGPPLSVQSDQGREFKNTHLKTMLNACGIQLQHGTPLRPQSQGVVERINQRIGIGLRVLESEHITWDQDLSALQLSINMEHHEALGMSPFEAVHGYVLEKPNFIPDKFDKEKSLRDFNGALWANSLVVRMHYALGQLYMKQASSKSTQSSGEIETKAIPTGTQVLIYHPQSVGEVGKLFRHWRGVFQIKRQVDRNVYIVFPVEQRRKELLVHRERIRILRPVSKTDQIIDETEEEKLENTDEKENGVITETPCKRSSGRTKQISYKKFY